ncbi:hypothetical protein P3T40_008101 [Paraburkholderia sp. EB58]|jgi:hypothetical protein
MKHGTHPTGLVHRKTPPGLPPICLAVRGSYLIGDLSLPGVYVSVISAQRVKA